jgi:hypothetical protein
MAPCQDLGKQQASSETGHLGVSGKLIDFNEAGAFNASA